jgi:peptide chain release factor 3
LKKSETEKPLQLSAPGRRQDNFYRKNITIQRAIQIAGAVKSNKIRKTATSDFLEIEKQREFSSHLRPFLEYSDKNINLLDTPVIKIS